MGIFQTHISFLLDFNKILVIVYIEKFKSKFISFEIFYRLRKFENFRSRIKLYVKLSNVIKNRFKLI